MSLLIIVYIDLRLFPFASRDLASEQDIDLAVRPSSHFWEFEVCDDKTEETRASPDIAAFAANCALLVGS
jgi:hypothetical protein